MQGDITPQNRTNQTPNSARNASQPRAKIPEPSGGRGDVRVNQPKPSALSAGNDVVAASQNASTRISQTQKTLSTPNQQKENPQKNTEQPSIQGESNSSSNTLVIGFAIFVFICLSGLAIYSGVSAS